MEQGTENEEPQKQVCPNYSCLRSEVHKDTWLCPFFTLGREGIKEGLVALHFKYDFWHTTAKAGLDVVQSGRPIFDDFFQHLWLYIDNNMANVVFQMVKRLWLIHID
ncbi:adhesion G protein-coupled receptor B2 [Trichonephila clavipes]|uniref:Adhesion G protein-coupled receptor B2 n=1 Tax=Trichonephila clavipes TaxID=2585209 RepID=A0A8X6SEU7_TRICX|nr:adhesion G protein-coupled receptor B2 [Trichonephila clavipes]